MKKYIKYPIYVIIICAILYALYSTTTNERVKVDPNPKPQVIASPTPIKPLACTTKDCLKGA